MKVHHNSTVTPNSKSKNLILFNAAKSYRKSTYFAVFTALLFIFIFINLQEARANMATDDYQAYLGSKYASASWNDYVTNGFEAFHSAEYDMAQTSLYKAFNKGCESPIVLFMLALISEYKQSYYSSLEYYKMAEKAFKNSNSNHRFSETFNENYGRALYYSGKKNEAMPILKKAGKKSKSYWLLKLLGLMAYEEGDALNALSYLERAVRVKSDDVTKEELVYIYGLLGKLFLHKGESDGAHRYYQKVIELDPNNPEAKQFMNGIERSYQNKQMMDLMDKMQDM